MEKPNYTFYVLAVNNHDAMAFNSCKETIELMKEFIEDDGDESYSIRPIHGIWELLERLGSFENYEDAWMEEVLSQASRMVELKKKEKQKLQEDQNSQIKEAD